MRVCLSFAFATSKESHQLLGLAFLNFFVFDHPVMVLIEKSEDLSQVFGLLLQEMVEDVELSPFYFFVIVKIISLKQLLLEFCLVEVFKVVWVGSLFDIASTFFNHFEN